MLCQKLCPCSMSCHCSSTWPVKTCLHAPERKKTSGYKWQISMNKTDQRWLLGTSKAKWPAVEWSLVSQRKAHLLLLCWGSVHKLNGSSVLRAQPAKPNKHLWNVTARQYLPFFSHLCLRMFPEPMFPHQALWCTTDSWFTSDQSSYCLCKPVCMCIHLMPKQKCIWPLSTVGS